MSRSIQSTLSIQTAGESWQMLARLRWPDESLIDQSTTGTDGVVDVTLKVYEVSSDSPLSAVYAPSNLTTASVVSTALAGAGTYWTRDSEGGNFRHVITPAMFTMRRGSAYLIRYTLNGHASNIYGSHVEDFYVTCA